MARRDSPRRKQEKAEDVARHLLSLQRTRGVPWSDSAGLWLLGRPADRPVNPSLLAASFLGNLPGRTELASALGCEEVTPLEPARLAKWEWGLAHLTGHRDLAELVREGVRPLRGYRGVDFPERLRNYRQTIDRFKELLERSSAIAACQNATSEDGLSAAVLVRALPARLWVLGPWPIDPAEVLQQRDLPADALLLDLARQAGSPALAALAGVLLGRRSRRASPSESQRLLGQLPASLQPLVLQARTSGHTPVLQALAFSQGQGPLPPLLGIPDRARESLLLASERAAVLYGPEVGLRVLDTLARPWQTAVDQAGAFRARLERFVYLVEAWQRGQAPVPRSADEADLVKGVRWLGRAGQGGPRLLVRLFVAWVSGAEHGLRCIGARPLVRIARAAWQAGPVAAVRALAEAWQKEAAERFCQEQPATATARARLELTLTHRDVHLPIPAHLTEQSLEQFSGWLGGLAADRVREVWPVLVGLPETSRGPWNQLLRSRLPAAVLERIGRLDVGWPANRLCDHPGPMDRYLDCVEVLLARDLPEMNVRDEWLAELFHTGPACMPGVVLTLLRRVHGGQAASDRPATLRALSQDLLASGPLGEHARALARALEAWDSPELTGPADAPGGSRLPARLAGVLEVELETLRQYLHHRRLAGHGETFARTLLEPLELAERETTEASFLTGRLASLPADAPKRSHLQERLSRLSDPVQAASRRAESVARARQRLERSLELLRQESLERILDGVYRTYLGRLLGKPVRPGPLPAGMREALALLHAPEISTQLLLGFLDDVLEGRSLGDREVNRAWLARARAAGTDTQAWLAGVQATALVAGETITFASEREPLQVLRMGSYFDTCLTLESGSNAASTLVNALDVNKQVIYGRRGDGAVVARKLLGATATGELAGYCTYGEGKEACRQALATILADFARRCKLRLSDRATPEVLHTGFWYDDGNEAWLAPEQPLPLPPPPPGEARDPAAVREWHLAEALRGGDAARLAALVLSDSDDAAHAALYRLLLGAPAGTEVGWSMLGTHDQDRVITLVAQRGGIAWVDLPASRFSQEDPAERLCALLDNLPWNGPAISRAIRRLKQAACRKDVGTFCHGGGYVPPRSCGLASAEELIELTEAMGRLQCHDCLAESVVGWAKRLQTAWLRDREARPLVRALTSDTPGLAELVAELACREVVPGVMAPLRSLLGQRGDQAERFALALGSQGEPADGPRLLALLERNPCSLELALAVVRSGHAEAAEKARRLWQPPRQVPDDAVILGRLRELASPRLARQMRGEVKELARVVATQGDGAPADSTAELRALLRKAALLGLPAPHVGDWGHEEKDHLQQVWEDVCRIDAQVARLEAGEAAPLAWWQELRGNVRRWFDSSLHDERFARAVRQIASRREDSRRHQALTVWLDLDDGPDPENIGQVLGLLRDDLADVPWSLRDRVALVLCRGWTHLPDVLAWLSGRPRQQPDLFAPSDVVFQSQMSDEAALALLLALESGDALEAQTARMLLEAIGRHAPAHLLMLLEGGFRWLHPEVIEPLAEELIQTMPSSWPMWREVATQLGVPGRSYRWQRLVVLTAWRLLDREKGCTWQQKVRTDQDNPRSPWLREFLARTSERQ